MYHLIKEVLLSLNEIYGHLGAAEIQSIPSDDQIIMNHVRDAKRITETTMILVKALRKLAEEE